jgi:hypothetical protein
LCVHTDESNHRSRDADPRSAIYPPHEYGSMFVAVGGRGCAGENTAKSAWFSSDITDSLDAREWESALTVRVTRLPATVNEFCSD